MSDLTDDARAEANRAYHENAPECGYSHQRDAYESGFRDGAQWAAARAETTTATVEDAARVLAPVIGRRVYQVEDGNDFDGLMLRASQALTDAGLLATARTRPTEGTRWWVPAYRTPNSRVQRIGSPTVLREYAEREVEQYQNQEAEDPEGNPDAIFLATRIEHPWTEVDRG